MILGFEEKKSDTELVDQDFLLVVGVLSGMGDHPGHNRTSPPKNPPAISQVAAWIEFGTKFQVARPFMRDAFSEENKGNTYDLFTSSIQAINRGKTTKDAAMGVIGARVVSTVQLSMDKYEAVDTGTTKRAISWAEVTRQGDPK